MQMIRRLLTPSNKIVGPVLEAAFSQRDSFQPLRKFSCFLLPAKLLLFKKTDTFFYRLTLHLLDP